MTCITPKIPDRDIRVELSQARHGHLCTGLPNIFLPQEKLIHLEWGSCGKESSTPYLTAQVRYLDGLWVVNCDGFDTGEDYVLCYCTNNGRCRSLETSNMQPRSHLPISTPRPFMPTIKTLDAAMRFMATVIVSILGTYNIFVRTFVPKDISMGRIMSQVTRLQSSTTHSWREYKPSSIAASSTSIAAD